MPDRVLQPCSLAGAKRQIFGVGDLLPLLIGRVQGCEEAEIVEGKHGPRDLCNGVSP